MEQSKNSGFNSKLGVILAAAGSAVGLGNIWKFPYDFFAPLDRSDCYPSYFPKWIRSV